MRSNAFEKGARVKICHSCFAGLWVSQAGQTVALVIPQFIPCPCCRLEKAFVVEDREDGDNFTTNPEFKKTLFHKYFWQVITDGIPITLFS